MYLLIKKKNPTLVYLEQDGMNPLHLIGIYRSLRKNVYVEHRSSLTAMKPLSKLEVLLIKR